MRSTLPRQSHSQLERVTHPGERLHLVAPRASAEIDGKQPATVIPKQRIDPDDLAALKVGEQLTIVERDERRVGELAAAHLGLVADAALPLVRAPWRVARSMAAIALPADREHVVATAERIAKEPELGSGGPFTAMAVFNTVKLDVDRARGMADPSPDVKGDCDGVSEVNGRSLIQIVREVESAFAGRDDQSSLAGGYRG